MLILTRRPDESIMIDDDIKIKVLGIRDNQILIGIEAPEDVVIVRKKLLEEDSTE